MKSLLSIWHYVVSVKSTVKILSFVVAFLENMNFNQKWIQNHWTGKKIFQTKPILLFGKD